MILSSLLKRSWQTSTRPLDYFCLNLRTDSSPVTPWEAYKAVLRGHVIQLATKRKRERLFSQRTLEERLELISTTFKQSPTPANQKLLDQASTKLDLCLNDEAERTLRWARQIWYTKANKPNTMLAKRLCTFTPITLHTCHNILTGNPMWVLDKFYYHLTTLYSAPNQSSTQGLDTFLNGLTLPS